MAVLECGGGRGRPDHADSRYGRVLVFFGDMGDNVYALDAKDGRKLWGAQFSGAVGGGVIAYDAGRGEKVAAATGLTEILWPTRITTAKVSILGLADH
jgi:alcohol dehydrogenase (cytochrome c)